jgi:hypothetical protein
MDRKVWFKRMRIAGLVPVAGASLLLVLLYVPGVQHLLFREAIRRLGKVAGMEINLRKARLAFPLHFACYDLTALAQGDTLFSLQALKLHIAPLPLFKQTLRVDSLRLQNLRLATGSLIDGMELRGEIGHLSAAALVRPAVERAEAIRLDVSDAFLSLRIDSVSQDGEASPAGWVASLERAGLRNVGLRLRIPAGSLALNADIGSSELKDARIDLGASRYTAGRISLANSRFGYDANERPPASGFDPAHIALSSLGASVDSFVYQDGELGLRIRELSAAERSGLEISALEGSLGADSLRIAVGGLRLRTPSSEASLQASVPWSALAERPQGKMSLRLAASIGKADLFVLLGAPGLHGDLESAWPNAPAVLAAEAEGNLASLTLKQLRAGIPGAFSFRAGGMARSLTDSLRRAAHIHWQVQTQQAGFALNFLPAGLRESFRIPVGLSFLGEAELENQEYKARLLLTEDRARLELKARYHSLTESYEATLDVDSLEPAHFMPAGSPTRLTASLRAEGKGAGLLADSAQGVWTGRIAGLRYGASAISDAAFSASLKDSRLVCRLKSDDPHARLELVFDGRLRRNELAGMLAGGAEALDLQGLGLSDGPLTTSFHLFAEIESDLRKKHLADLTLGNWELEIADLHVRPKTLVLHAQTGADTTALSLHAGDLGFTLSAGRDAESLGRSLAGISAEVSRQLREDSTLNMRTLRALFPRMALRLGAGRDNPAYHLLQPYDIDFGSFSLEASSAPDVGLRAEAKLYALSRDTFRIIDTLRAAILPDSAGWVYKAEAIKNKYRQQSPFGAQVKGSLRYGYADAELSYQNSLGETGLLLGVRGSMEAGGFRLRFYPGRPVIAFTAFELNPDNYIRFKSLKEIEADVRFAGEGNTSLQIRSLPNEGGLPEVHAELNNLDLGVVSGGFAGMPRLGGVMSVDLRYAPSEQSFLVAGNAHVDTFAYEGGRVGELMLNAVYLPLEEDVHQVDAHFYRERNEVAAATAVYEAKQNRLDGSLSAGRLPLSMLTPFIPGRAASLKGALNGLIEVSGSVSAPQLNGYLQADTASVYAEVTASRFYIDNKRLEIENNLLKFDGFELRGGGKKPLRIRGDIDFNDLSRPTANLRLEGSDLQVFDAGRNTQSLVYGKLLAGVDARLRGPLNALSIRGDVRLLGGTNMTYVMKESPLTVQDRLKDLVSFTSFADTTLRRPRRRDLPPVPLAGMEALMQIHIDPVVQLRADLAPDQSSYVVLEGGGELSFQYTRQGEMLLNGRYTLSDGKLKYALPVIPLKEFRLKKDSYIQWDGNPVNPLLSLTATQQMRTSVSLAGESPRMVNFETGIDVGQRAENMSLLFTLNAPEDIAVQEELNRMGAEGRSTQAVGMMVTGMYLAGGNAGKVNLNIGAALSSFLQNEIGHIAGDAFKTVDVSFGVDTYDQESEAGAGQRTDYSFRFAKRFYNDRLRVVLGGKISSGEVQQKEAFIDNASLEWRLNQSGTGYLKVFHDKNYQSILDGEVTETGFGLVLRRKMRRLHELFNPFSRP